MMYLHKLVATVYALLFTWMLGLALVRSSEFQLVLTSKRATLMFMVMVSLPSVVLVLWRMLVRTSSQAVVRNHWASFVLPIAVGAALWITLWWITLSLSPSAPHVHAHGDSTGTAYLGYASCAPLLGLFAWHLLCIGPTAVATAIARFRWVR